MERGRGDERLPTGPKTSAAMMDDETGSIDSSIPGETVQPRYTNAPTATEEIPKDAQQNSLAPESDASSTSRHSAEGVGEALPDSRRPLKRTRSLESMGSDLSDVSTPRFGQPLVPPLSTEPLASTLPAAVRPTPPARRVRFASDKPRPNAREKPTPADSTSEDGIYFSAGAADLPAAIPSNAQKMAALNHTLESLSETGQDESTNIQKPKKRLWDKVGKKSGANASSAMRGTKSLTNEEWLKITKDIALHLTQKGYTTHIENSDITNFSKKMPPPLEDLSVKVQRDKGKLRMLSNLPPIELAAAWAVTGQSPLTISKATPENAKAILKAFEDNHPTFGVIIGDALLQAMDAQGQAAYAAHKARLPATKSSPGPAQTKPGSKTPESVPTSSNPKPADSPPPLPNPSPDGSANGSGSPRKTPRM